jgi:hypothetical protein
VRDTAALVRAVLGGAVVALVAAAVATGLLQALGGGVAFGAALALAALVVLALRVLPRLAPAPDPPPAPRPAPPSSTVVVDVGASTLGQSLASPVHFDRVLRPRLVALAEDRLRRHHGLDPRRHPEQARALAGEDLWDLLHSRDHPQSAAALGALVTRIEAL